MRPIDAEPLARLRLKIGGMQCSFCVASVEKALTQLDGVERASVSLAHEEALVYHDPAKVSAEPIRDTLRSLGYTVRDPRKVRSFEEEETELRRHRGRLLAAAGVMLLSLGFMTAMWFGLRRPWFPWVMLALALAMIFGIGWPILKMAAASLRRGILNQHVLMEFAAFGGLAGGLVGFFKQPWPMADFLGAAVFITAYHILSGYVSLLVRTRSSQAIRKLMSLQPATARVVRDGREQEIPVEEVSAGDRVRIRPGESIPVDGEVVGGASAVDESLVTGEFMPVDKALGDTVIGGSVNRGGTLLVRTTRIGEESFLQQVARSIEQARALKPGILQLVDRVLKYFVPGVLITAAGAFVIWILGAWLITGAADLSRALYATLAALVMGYPCALGMAAPLAMIRGGGMAAQKGILMRSGEAFQVFKDVRKVVLDKTGTLTLGQPQVAEVVASGGSNTSEVLALAAAVERLSEHPLARAIVNHAAATGVERHEAEAFEALPGHGVLARVGGQAVWVGSPRFLPAARADVATMQDSVGRLEKPGATVVAVTREDRVVGLIAITDTLKPDAREAVARMKARGLTPVMISGDNARTARAVAAQVGIDEVMAQVLPEDKAAEVRRLQQTGCRVAMVGDGINDAPALTQADVGIAIGAGTDIAIETADIVLVGERLGGVVDAYEIGKASFRKTVQNVILAFAFNGIGVPAAVTGLVHPVMAMVAMAASVTAVLLNSFGGRLLLTWGKVKDQEAKRLVLKVPTMHCEGCLAQIREALAGLRGVKNIEGGLAEKTITIEVDGRAPGREQLCGILARLGHLCGDTGVSGD